MQARALVVGAGAGTRFERIEAAAGLVGAGLGAAELGAAELSAVGVGDALGVADAGLGLAVGAADPVAEGPAVGVVVAAAVGPIASAARSASPARRGLRAL